MAGMKSDWAVDENTDQVADAPKAEESPIDSTTVRKAGDDSDNKPPVVKGGLERLTVNLIPRSSRALERGVELTGDSKTVVVNRALQLYAYLEEAWAAGGEVVVTESRGATPTVLKVF